TDVVDKCVRHSLEGDAGEENEGVRLAHYFERKAPKVTSAYGLLAHPLSWKVIQAVFGFPEEMAAAVIDRQVSAVLQRLNVDDLQDLAKVERMIDRFTAVWDAQQTATQEPVLSLFSNSSSPSISLDAIMTLKTLK